MASSQNRWYTKWYILLPSVLFGLLLILGGISDEQVTPDTQADVEVITPSTIPQTTRHPERAVNYESAERYQGIVEKVVDGDTIHVRVNGQKQKVRLIGIDTPEKNDPRKPVECFAQEASDWLTQMIEGKTVTLETDDSQGDTDKYDRFLRYVFLDEMNMNQQLISEGYAYEYTYDLPYRYQDQFRLAQQETREAGHGLWDPEACDGQRTLSASPTSEPASPGDQTPEHVPGQDLSDQQFGCDCSRTCAQINSCEEAYYQLNSCGCTNRDGDEDGVPCERGPC